MVTPRRLTLATALLVWWCSPLHAQGAWDVILNIDPYPSPYYSDWDVDPNIATLTVINTTPSAQRVRIHFSVTNHANKVVLSGASDPQDVGAGATVIFDNPYDVAGTTNRDTEEDELAARTGRLREGDYTACAVVADANGFSLAESCVPFTIVYPDPPLLIGPDNGEVITQTDPLFQWTPVQVPVDYQLSYVMRVVEVLEHQTPQEALRANIPHYQDLDGQFSSLRYPIDARPLEAGKQYAWTVQALDQNGYAAAGNDGRSEIWTFRYDDGTGATPGSIATTFSLFNTVDADSADADAADAEDRSKLNNLCGSSAKPGFLGLNIKSPLGFPAFKDSPATIHRDTTTGEWWVFTENQTLHRQVLLYGKCPGPFGGLKWLASKKIGRQQRLNEWLSINLPPVGIESIDFGMFVLALSASTVSAPDVFREGSEFLAGHEIEVLRGLNAFAVLNLHEHALWPAFENLGYQEKQIELQGFIGFDVSWAVSVTGAVGKGEAQGSADLSKQRTFLKLRAALPERKPIGLLSHVVQSMRLGFEFEIKDSTGYSLGAKKEDGKVGGGLTQKSSFEFVPKITHTMTLREDLFPRIEGSRELVGSFGVSIASESETDDPIKNKAKQRWMSLQRKSGPVASGVKSVGTYFGGNPDAMVCAADPNKGKKTDYVLTYGLEGDIVLGSVVIESPAFEVHIQKSKDGKAVSGDDRGLSFAVATTIRGVDWERGIGAGISVERSPDKGAAAPADSTCSPRKRALANADTMGSPTRPRSNADADKQAAKEPEAPATRPRANADADKETRDVQQTQEKASPAKPTTKWKVQWRLATESMPLMELLRGIGSMIAGVVSAFSQ